MRNWSSIVESLLFAAGDEGLTLKQISQVLEIDDKLAEEVLCKLMEDYNCNPDRGIMIVELAGTYQLATKKENAP